MVNYKFLSVLFVFIFLISFASSIDSFGIYKKDSCINLVNICSNCTYSNISAITYPNSTTSLSNIEMTKDGTYYSYEYCLTSTNGDYLITGVDDYNGELNVWEYKLTVNPNGQEVTVSHSIIYSILLLIIVVMFFVFGIGALNIEGSDERNELSEIIHVNWKKYIKWACITFTWLTFVWFSYIAYSLSYGILQFSTMTNIFNMMFRMSMILFIPVFVGLWLYGAYRFVSDLATQKIIDRGLRD